MQKKKNSFKTPEGYFDSFCDKLMSQLSIEETRASKQDGFKVPDAYLETVYDKIKQQLPLDQPKVIPLHPFKKYYYALAAIAAVLLLYMGLKLNNNTTLTFDAIAHADIESYFDYNELGLSSYEIAEVIPVDEFEINNLIDNRLSDENIMDYLANSVDDFDELNLYSDEE